MAVTLQLSVRGTKNLGGKIDAAVQQVIDKVLPIFLEKLAAALVMEMQRQMPRKQRSAPRGRPPYSKSGHARNSLRAVRKGNNRVVIDSVFYLRILQSAGWDSFTPAWHRVRPKINKLWQDAARQAGVS